MKLKYTVLIFSLFSFLGCSKDNSLEKPIIGYNLPKFKARPGSFSSCTELKTWAQQKDTLYKYEYARYLEWERAQGWQVMPVSSTIDSAGKGHVSVTNLQESDVDEPDVVKMRDTQIYHARSNSIQVFHRKSLEHVGNIEFSGGGRLQLLQQGDDLVVLQAESNRLNIYLYGLSSNEMPQLRAEYNYQGGYRDGRLKAGQLIVVSQDNLNINRNLEQSSMYSQSNCRNIQKPFIDSFDLTITQIHSIQLNTLSDSTTSQVGAVEQIYMGESLYLVRAGTSSREWFYWDDRLRLGETDFDKAIVAKYSLDLDDEVTLTHAGQVKGQIYSQWAMKEDRERDLFFVTTTVDEIQSGGFLGGTINQGIRYNQLWALGEGEPNDLVIKGVSNPFGKTEDIRAVRYIGDMAYVVTFKKTDPVFAINLKNLPKLSIEGELHIPGFSAYLHPLPGGRLLGMGYDAVDMGNFAWFQGPQLSLFDISEPTELARTDFVTMGERGSHIDVTVNHHAFHYSEARELISFSARLFEYESATPNGGAFAGKLVFSGLLLYSVKDRFQEVGRVTHSEWIPRECRFNQERPQWWQTSVESLDVQRSFIQKNRLYVFSPFAVETYSLKNLSQSKTQYVYGDNQEECGRIQAAPSGPVGWD